MATEQKEYDVFISYSRKDYVDENKKVIPENVVSKVKDALTRAGITYWFDEEGIYSGDNFVEKIINNIEASRIFVYLSTANANDSKWTCKEISSADEMGKHIIPVRIDRTPYNKKVLFRICDLDYIEYYVNPDQGMEKLITSIKKCLNDLNEPKIRAEIMTISEDYQQLANQQEVIANELVEKNRALGNTKKTCPVCEMELPIEAPYCNRCGWHFSALYAMNGHHSQSFDKMQRALCQTNWTAANKAKMLETEQALLKDRLTQATNQSASLKRDLEESLKKAAQQYEDLTRSLQARENELFQLKSGGSKSEKEIKSLNDRIASLEKQLKEAEDRLYLEWQKQEGLNDQLAQTQQQLKAVTQKLQEAQAKPKLPPIIQQIIDNMVYVEGGTFMMGASDKEAHINEYPVHKVQLDSFSIGRTPVTQEQWEAVMGNNPSLFKGAKLPVESVSWDDCQTFIKKLNQMTGKTFRLPTEAEWEFAARGGNRSKGYKYSGSNNVQDVAWLWENSGDKPLSGEWNKEMVLSNHCRTHEVATKQANELGLYDMSGNVWEWCQDWYGNYSSSAQSNPTGSTSGSYRVDRGGSWYYYTARGCRVSYRADNSPTSTGSNLGFRLAQ